MKYYLNLILIENNKLFICQLVHILIFERYSFFLTKRVNLQQPEFPQEYVLLGEDLLLQE